MVGRAQFEQQDYSSVRVLNCTPISLFDHCTSQAERALKKVRFLEPHRLWDMEVYSTLLWHLQKTVDLSFLAQELLNINPRSPQAWIAIGNLFSLQKEKTQALACFHRAAQLDPSCAYAYTLSGHESIDEDLDKAITFFQSALRADPRHYNAWYVSAVAYQDVNSPYSLGMDWGHATYAGVKSAWRNTTTEKHSIYTPEMLF